ncbi:DUF4386 domain-containing protein [Aquimarina sp. BL5]|uniref:DUF4386 domain-containing protein n=1 Tax=Aquimarina sp. BL5 TaxID=1714860 RepID=UPI000E511970|nr:DUF4386 domain-containing protein [Aquimarina sp. BL5]AXT52902.1 DUF4386 domain-containing protein [Aquimarina sp. BL5]RKN02281.1 DUF4386 family protein [Aquimarina sp. BL5]
MKTLSKASGIAYLLIFISGFYANFTILTSLVDLNNSEQTTLNIINNSIQFRQGLIGFLVMLTSDVFLIWSLFKITEPTHKTVSYIASLFRGLHASFFLIALVKLIKVYTITSEETNSVELQTSIIDLLSNFDKLWTIGLLFFGVHLLLLGFLALKSNYIPRIIGFLLILGALGYAIDGSSKLYLASYSEYQSYFEAIVIFTGVIGELSFTIWLLVKDFSQKKL